MSPFLNLLAGTCALLLVSQTSSTPRLFEPLAMSSSRRELMAELEEDADVSCLDQVEFCHSLSEDRDACLSSKDKNDEACVYCEDGCFAGKLNTGDKCTSEYSLLKNIKHAKPHEYFEMARDSCLESAQEETKNEVSHIAKMAVAASDSCWADGTVCGRGTTCNNCCNTAYNALGTQCGGEPLPDGTVCGVGLTCDLCKNPFTYWKSKGYTAACGGACYPDGESCHMQGSICNSCCNKATYWLRENRDACGPEPCWPDGTVCGAGTTCSKCCNEARNALGTQCGGDAWADGTLCALGTTCNFCQNPATHWDKKLGTRCGTEPGWGPGETCGKGTTCHNCRYGERDLHGPMCWMGVCLCA